LGLIGKLMGLFVGIIAIYSSNELVVATAAKRSIEELVSHLTREAVVSVSDLKSSRAPRPIETLTVDAEPMDHLKYYLDFPVNDFLATWFKPQNEVRHFPDFRYTFDDLTPSNEFARKTGYLVYRAKSSECQNLWFGTTKPEVVNLERLSQIAGQQITYEEVNHEPHPLA